MEHKALLLLIMAGVMDKTLTVRPGTTPHFRDIFIGRCWDYQYDKYRDLMNGKRVNCTQLWDAFYHGFANKGPCGVDSNSYKAFADIGKQDVPPDKALFWSGTYVIAHDYAADSRRYVTLEDTLLGYVVDGLTWCGSVSGPSGMNMTACPDYGACPEEARTAFWSTVSNKFSEASKGVVTFVLDGSRDRGNAYRLTSFLATDEIPSLPRSQVSMVLVLVAHTPGKPVKETCKNGSLITLSHRLDQLGLFHSCVDDPAAIVHLLCADNPGARECRLLGERHGLTSPAPYLSAAASCLISPSTVLLVFSLILITVLNYFADQQYV